jgi:alginate production protein
MTQAQFRLLYAAMTVVAVGTAAHAAAAQANRPASQSGVNRYLQREADEHQLSQFQLPGRAPGVPAAPGAPKPAAPSGELKYEYVYGAETEFVWRKNNDLNRHMQDNFAHAAPTVFGAVVYRPTAWLETRFEGTIEKLFALREEELTVDPADPTGPPIPHDKKPASALIDQAYAKFKPPGVPVEVTVGRRDFGDWRLWLYDGSLDGVHVAAKAGDFAFEGSLTRENFKELDLFLHEPRGRITNYIFHAEYRGIEDHRFAAYYIYRRDVDFAGDVGGRPEWSGLRAIGRPSDSFNYWADIGQVRGWLADGGGEFEETLRGWAYEAGGTYRFLNLPWQPSVTLGYAYGSGDDTAGDGRNNSYIQTGFHSNEQRFGGVTQFKYYGEFLDPELSNLKIFSAGVGARPLANMWVDLVYHKYLFNQPADPNDPATAFRGGQGTLSAVPYGVAGQESKDVGQEIDVIIGFRNLIGVRGLGLELRSAWFLPGKAYRYTDFETGQEREGDVGYSLLAAIFL